PATPPPAIYTLSLHDALPISLTQSKLPSPRRRKRIPWDVVIQLVVPVLTGKGETTSRAPRPANCSAVGMALSGGTSRAGLWLPLDRKSTRLNSSHDQISYAVF